MKSSISHRRTVVMGIANLLVGGTEMQTLAVVKVLVSGGYRVVVCCYHEYLPEVVAQFETAGVEVVLLDLERQHGVLGLLALIPSLVNAFKVLKPDIVHVQYIAPGLLPILAARLARVPVVLSTIHIAGTVAYGVKAKIMLRTAALFCNAFICVSKDVERFWFGDAWILNGNKLSKRRKHFTIYNAVDSAYIRACCGSADRDAISSELNLTGKKNLGIVGRLAIEKGHAVLLDAMVEILKLHPEIILIVIGDGPERLSLEAQATRLGIGASIRWLGALKQEQAFRHLAVFDIFVMPSLFEGFGLTAAEAMAAGLPVIGTNVGGLAEVIKDDETGLLVPPSDPDAFADAVIDLLEQPQKARQFGQAGKDRVDKMFSLGRFSDAMLGAYAIFSNAK